MTILVAEIGQNHCGDMELARTLMGLAKLGGADLVKFQLYDHKKVYGSNGHIPNVELSFDQAKALFDYGKGIGIEVFFSVFDVERVQWCERIGVEEYKVAYSRRHNRAILNAVKATGKPFVVSSDNPEFENTLYCIPKYPALIEDIDWVRLQTCIGFSDHTIGLEASKRAIREGAQIIEKHFALDHKTGIDAEWSMNFKELKTLKKAMR